jgi:hypothetical protein
MTPDDDPAEEMEKLELEFKQDLEVVFGAEKLASFTSPLKALLWELWLKSKERNEARREREEQALFENRMMRSAAWKMIEKLANGVEGQMDRKIKDHEEHVKNLTYDQLRTMITGGPNVTVTAVGTGLMIDAISRHEVSYRVSDEAPVIAKVPAVEVKDRESDRDSPEEEENQQHFEDRIRKALKKHDNLNFLVAPSHMSTSNWLPVFMNATTGQVSGMEWEIGDRKRLIVQHCVLTTEDYGSTWQFPHPRPPEDSSPQYTGHIQITVNGEIISPDNISVAATEGSYPTMISRISFQYPSPDNSARVEAVYSTVVSESM